MKEKIVFTNSLDNRYEWVVIETEDDFEIAIKIDTLIVKIGFQNTLNNCVEHINNNLL